MQSSQYDSPYKIYVDVDVKFYADGRIMPIAVTWEDGRVFPVERVLDVRRAASLKAGGAGIRYTCRIAGKQAALFLEENKWFMERKHPCADDTTLTTNRKTS